MVRASSENESGLTVSSSDLRRAIAEARAAETIVSIAKHVGEQLATRKRDPLSTSQIRAIFEEVRVTQWFCVRDPIAAERRMVLLQPKMRYRAAKEKGAVKDLVDNVLDPALQVALESRDVDERRKRFGRFVELLEAILAYHKAAGGK